MRHEKQIKIQFCQPVIEPLAVVIGTNTDCDFPNLRFNNAAPIGGPEAIGLRLHLADPADNLSLR